MLSSLLRSLRTSKHPKKNSRPWSPRYRPDFECLERRELYSASIVEHTIPTSGSGAIDIARTSGLQRNLATRSLESPPLAPSRNTR